MLAFARLVKKGDFVIEVGWHIGYITLYLANLVGQDGKVIVFEPGSNNVPYIRKNISSVSNIVLVEKAVTDFVGNARFYIENLSGQNNSLFENSEILDANIRRAGITSVERKEVEVACTTLDTFLNDNGLPVPSFIKIDVEGAELSVLNGMRNTLQGESIALMIEVMKNPDAIYDLLTGSGFQMYRSDKGPVDGPEKMKGNVFCIKGEDGRRRLLFFMNAT
jgi:FkbM family methyltransferase